MSMQPTIQVTSQDFARIQEAMSRASSQTWDLLDQELERAKLVSPQLIPGDVITMNSSIIYEDLSTGRLRPIQLVYPRDANISEGRVSVLAPLGSALLGLKVGDEIDWPSPGGQRRLRVKKLVYQPESSGDWQL